MSALRHSAICYGRVRHRRALAPRREFSYRICMLYLDLSELTEAGQMSRLFGTECARPWSFRRRDYLGPQDLPLDEAVRRLVARDTGRRPAGPVRLLTQVRAFGYVFNPVSFYYCFAPDGATLEAVVAEITNTPWQERHAYVLPAGASGGGARASFRKIFHVSPFQDMDHDYSWAFSDPQRRLAVSMRNSRDGRPVFKASFAAECRPFSARELRRAFVRAPWMGWKTHAAIYWQAALLLLRRAPFFTHPAKRQAAFR
jgi:DUF1365 family protein